MAAARGDGGVTAVPPPRGPARVLVIGYGNALRTDDGVGWHAARLLAGDPRLAGAVVLACHQLAPELALDLSAATLVILVDASTAAPPGTITVRPLAAPGASSPDGGPDRSGAGSAGEGPGATSHHVDPQLLLALARELYGAAPEAIEVSVGVADMGPGEALTPRVAAGLPAVADAVARLVAEHEERAAGEEREPA
jgi:Ni,Fe-hydrogenase maturation factor